MIKEYRNLTGGEPFLSITWELDFSQAYSFWRMLMNHKNFHFTQIADKANNVIFLKSPKTMFLGHFLTIFALCGFFSKKIQLSHTTIYGPLTSCKVSKKNLKNEPISRKLMNSKRADRRRDKQTLFYRTFPTEPGGATASLQQMTGGNTPNLVLKRMLRDFKNSTTPENITILRLK